MTPDFYITLAREALLLVLLISAPPLAAVLVVSAVTGLFQSALQIRDPALSFVPKLVVVVLALVVAAPWIGAQMLEFTELLLSAIPSVGTTP